MPSWSDGVQIAADPGAAKLALDFPDRESLQQFFAEALPCRAFLVPLDEQPEPFVTYAVAVNLRDRSGLTFQATAVQAFPDGAGFSVAFQFAGWDAGCDAQLAALLDPATEEPLAEDPETDEALGEMLGTSPIFRIKALDLSARIQLAPKADRAERTILCRDTMAPVLLALLSNPRLDAENVLAIVKSVYANPDILQRLASDRRWLASTEIRIALVRNPKTPTPIAQRLLETLPLNELRSLAKMGSSKEDLRRIALNLVTKAFSSR